MINPKLMPTPADIEKGWKKYNKYVSKHDPQPPDAVRRMRDIFVAGAYWALQVNIERYEEHLEMLAKKEPR